MLRRAVRVAARRSVHTEARIAKLGYSLPTLPQPAGAYTLAVKQGNWVYTAGHLPFKENMKDLHVGRVGVDYTAEQASDLAKITALEYAAHTAHVCFCTVLLVTA